MRVRVPPNAEQPSISVSSAPSRAGAAPVRDSIMNVDVVRDEAGGRAARRRIDPERGAVRWRRVGAAMMGVEEESRFLYEFCKFDQFAQLCDVATHEFQLREFVLQHLVSEDSFRSSIEFWQFVEAEKTSGSRSVARHS